MRFIFNLPWTILGLFLGIISFPKKAGIKNNALVSNVSSLWWTHLFCYMRGARAVTMGYTILLGPNVEPRDLEHEIIHVKQFKKYPFIYPFLYMAEVTRKGSGLNNRFEKEAYEKAGNVFKTH